MAHSILANNRARKLALSLVCALFIGNLLSESGDIISLVFHQPWAENLVLNLWLAISLIGIAGYCISLARRHGS